MPDLPVPQAGQEDQRWRTRALCAGRDPAIFIDELPEAKAVCEDCPVRLECREYALSKSRIQGTWGGMTFLERRRERRRRRVIVLAEASGE